MRKLGNQRSAWKVQRGLMCELPGMGKAGALERRAYPPGQHGFRRRKFSEYAFRLREKQKLLFNYGLREAQLRRFVRMAKSGKQTTSWMTNLIAMLESRLDCVVFRLGFAPSIPAARQLISHRKVHVNGKRLTIASALVPIGAEVTLTDAGYKGTLYQSSIVAPRLTLPDWLELQAHGEFKKGRLKLKPPIDAVPFPFDSRLVVEHYAGV